MKGKITIVLFSLALVFGMIAASCDNGDFPDKDATFKDASTLVYYKAGTVAGLPEISTNTGTPIRYSGADAKKLLDAKVEYPSGTKTFVPENQVVTVAYNPVNHGAADSPNGKVALQYAGLQIIAKIVR